MDGLHRAIFSALAAVDTLAVIVQKRISMGILGGAPGLYADTTDGTVVYTNFARHTFL